MNPATNSPALRPAKAVIGHRLAWYAQAPTEEYWHQHWEETVNPEYYARARTSSTAVDILTREILRFLSREGRLVEAGCGSGWFVALLSHAGYDVDGVDSSVQLVHLVNQVMPSLPVRVGDVGRFEVADMTYQSYLSIGVMEHDFRGPERLLAEAFRILRPGGRAVISVPAFGPLRRFKARVGLYASHAPPDLEFYQFAFHPKEFAELARESGFAIRKTTFMGLPRLLQEEVPAYRHLATVRGGQRFVRDPIVRAFHSHDGHMIIYSLERCAT